LAPEVALREWDDELVVYNDLTGSTHHLDALGAEVLLALLRSPAGIDTTALTRDIAARVELGAGVELTAEIERTLGELAGFRLADPAPETCVRAKREA
jgi:PqqD family protein of HPr-rel-A system